MSREEPKYTITVLEKSQMTPSVIGFDSKEEYEQSKSKLEKCIENKEQFTIVKEVNPGDVVSISYSHE